MSTTRRLSTLHQSGACYCIARYVPDSVMLVMLQASLLIRENKAGRAEEVLAQFTEKYPDKSKVFLLARLQLDTLNLLLIP